MAAPPKIHFTNNTKGVQTMEKVDSLAFGPPFATRMLATDTVLGGMHSVRLIADDRCAQSTLSAAQC